MSDILDRKSLISKDGLLNKTVLVRASAGSGKTSILVDRLVALIESSDEVKIQQIVALTFTKKAANEFYERLYKTLSKRIQPGYDIKNDKDNKLLLNPTSEAIERDKKALYEIDNCFLGTIDAFNLKILSEHPIEANISTSSKIVDEEDENRYILKIYQREIDNADIKFSQNIKYIQENIPFKNIKYVIKEILDKIYFNLVIPDESNLLNKIKNNLNTLVTVLRQIYDQIGTVGKNKNASRGPLNYMLEHKTQLLNINDLNSYSLSEVKTLLKGTENFWIKLGDGGYMIHCDFSEIFTFDGDKIYFSKKVLDEINNLIYSKAMPFLNHVAHKVNEEMLKDGLLTYQTSMVKALELLKKDSKNNQKITKALQDKYKYYFLDECQDTDLLQYELLFRLTSNNLDVNDFTTLKPKEGSLFIVGDKKQSIYHFRGADIKTYEKIESLFHEDNPNKIGKMITLTSNFRSKKQLREYFNNKFSEDVFSSLNHDDIPLDDDKKENNIAKVYKYYVDRDRNAPLPQIILKLKNKYGYKFQDFMLLPYSKSEIKNTMKALAKFNIPYYTEGDVEFSATNSIIALTRLFNYLIDPSDQFNNAELLSTNIFNYDFINGDYIPKEINNDLINDLKKYRELKLSSSTILEKLVNTTTFIKRLGIYGYNLLNALITLLKEEEMKGNISSYKDASIFLNDLLNDNDIERVSLLQHQLDAVMIANVHKVKGLQNKVVILIKADISSKQLATTSYFDYENKNFYLFSVDEKEFNSNIIATNINKDSFDDIEIEYKKNENNRILYVAATRAEEILLIPEAERYNKRWESLLYPNIESIDVLLKDIDDIDSGVATLKIGDNEIKEEYINDDVLINENLKKETYTISNASTIKANTDVEKASDESEKIYINRNKKDDPTLYGSIVHRLMEFIVKAKEKKLDISICDLIVNEFDAQNYKNDLIEVYKTIYSTGYKNNDSAIINIYELIKNNVAKAETPYSYLDGDKLHYGKIDLIIEKDNEVLIIDYKTDTKEQDHTAQLDEYKKALANFYQGKDIKTYIYLLG